MLVVSSDAHSERNIGRGVGGRRRRYSGGQGAVSQALREQRGLGGGPRVSQGQFAAEAEEEETERGSYSDNSCIRGCTSLPVVFYLP